MSLLHVPPLALAATAAWLAGCSSAPAGTGTRTAEPARGTAAVAPRSAAPKPARIEWREGSLSDRVVVKFVDAVAVRMRDGRLTAAADLSPFDSVLARFPEARVKRLHSVDEATLDRKRASGQRATGRALPDLNNYYVILFPGPTDRAVELANQLLPLELLESVSLEPRGEPPAAPPSAEGTPGGTGQRALPSHEDGGIPS